MALGQCRECGRNVSDSAKACPGCGIKTPVKKSVGPFQALIVIGVFIWIISKMGGMLGVEHTASTTSASVTPKVSSISVDSLYVNGKEIQIGDTADQVFKLLTKDQMVSQTEEKDPNNALSLLLIKHIQVNGGKFAVYFSRVQDPGPYKVIKIIENTASQVPSQSVTKSTATTSPELKTVKSIIIHGRTISIGDTYDSVLEVLSPSEEMSQSIHRDDIGNMTLMKYFDADGKKFCLTVARVQDPGPYRIVSINLQ